MESNEWAFNSLCSINLTSSSCLFSCLPVLPPSTSSLSNLLLLDHQLYTAPASFFFLSSFLRFILVLTIPYIVLFPSWFYEVSIMSCLPVLFIVRFFNFYYITLPRYYYYYFSSHLMLTNTSLFRRSAAYETRTLMLRFDILYEGCDFLD